MARSQLLAHPNGSVVFYCRWGHSQLEFAPAMKGITTSRNELPTVIDKLITATNEGVLDQQMAALSDEVAKKITGGRKKSSATANKKAA
jgi:hypothetical protein